MATRKKKSDVITLSENLVSVVKGSHLTVTTFPDGRTELLWDDEALERDVRDAIASVEQKPAVKAKAATRAKKKAKE